METNLYSKKFNQYFVTENKKIEYIDYSIEDIIKKIKDVVLLFNQYSGTSLKAKIIKKSNSVSIYIDFLKLIIDENNIYFYSSKDNYEQHFFVFSLDYNFQNAMAIISVILCKEYNTSLENKIELFSEISDKNMYIGYINKWIAYFSYNNFYNHNYMRDNSL